MASSNTAAQNQQIGNQGILIVGLLAGLFIIPPIARSAPTLINGFLMLVLFSSLLLNRNRWLPAFTRFTTVAGSATKK